MILFLVGGERGEMIAAAVGSARRKRRDVRGVPGVVKMPTPLLRYLGIPSGISFVKAGGLGI
jgi:hypothetical protein